MKIQPFTVAARELLRTCGPLTGDAARLAHFLSQAVDRLESIRATACGDIMTEACPDDIPENVRQMWKRGDKIAAIKEFRNAKGLSLMLAKNTLENVLR